MTGKKGLKVNDVTAARATRVAWPAIYPKAIDANSVEWLIEDQLCLIPNYLTAKECSAFIATCSSQQLLPSPPAKKGEAHRTNARFSSDDPSFAQRLWDAGLSLCCSSWLAIEGKSKGLPASGLNSNIRVYRYEPSQLFGAHYDGSVTDAANGKRSEWTLLIYLSGAQDGVEGGETVFYKDHSRKGGADREVVAPLDRGTALLHRHGDVSDCDSLGSNKADIAKQACMLHEGRPPIKGTKWVLRSDVMFG